MPTRRPLAPLLLVLSLTACGLDQGPTSNPYSGCYDASCVDRPVVVSGIPALTAVSTFDAHTCGLGEDGSAWCWGANEYGQLGDGTDQSRNRPVQVAGGIRFRTIAVGQTTTCGVAIEGTLYCWGAGALGQPGPDRCGRGQVPCAMSPLALDGGPWTTVAAGTLHACAIAVDGGAWCWGFNFLGETGSAAYSTATLTPQPVPGSRTFASIGAGDSYTCALTTEGAAYCWGSADRGELGTTAVGVCRTVAGFQNYCTSTPVPVMTTWRFTSISVGYSHVCGLTATGIALCWGDNGQGQLGTKGYAAPSAPVIAQNGMSFSVIDASAGVTCGTPPGGPSVCWGLNAMGKLGVGTRVEMSTTPLPIVGKRRYSAFAGGQYHVCGVTDSGETWCWGSGRFGQLGAGPMLP